MRIYLHVIWKEEVQIKLRCSWRTSFFLQKTEGDTVVRIEEDNLFMSTEVEEQLSCYSVHWVQGSVSEMNGYFDLRTAYHCQVARVRLRSGWARCKPMLCIRVFRSAWAADTCYVACYHSRPTMQIELVTQELPVFLPFEYRCFPFRFGFNIAPGNLLLWIVLQWV
jgi:hypothetical protein